MQRTIGIGCILLAAAVCQAQDQTSPKEALETLRSEAIKKAQEEQKKRIREFQKQLQTQQLMFRMVHAAQNPIIRKELEITEEQAKTMRELQRKLQLQMPSFQLDQQKQMQQINQLRTEGQHVKANQMQQDMQLELTKVAEKQIKEVEKVLLPHQIKRAKQITRQQVLQNTSGFHDEFGLPYAIADELELDKAEKAKLRDTIEEARKDYYARMEELKTKTHKKIMESLPASKRDKVREILGEYFDERKGHRKLADEKRSKSQ